MLSLQKLAPARSENSPVAVTNYCNNHPKIANVKINIQRKLVLACRQNFKKSYFMIWSRSWHSEAIWGVLPEMNLAAIYKVSINLKLFCYQNDISISYGYLVIFSNSRRNTDL